MNDEATTEPSPSFYEDHDTCRCTEADAGVCDGGGVRPRADGACGCPCHGGAEATNAVAATEPECTGETARWCPRHGDCTCPPREDWPDEPTFDGETCPLHGRHSTHNADEAWPDEINALNVASSAADEALDAIARLCGCPEWDYPNQLVRDVQAVVNERDALRLQRDAAVEFVLAERELAKVHPAQRSSSEAGVAAVRRVRAAQEALGATVASDHGTAPVGEPVTGAEARRG